MKNEKINETDTKQMLELFVKNSVIMIDTCSLMHDKSGEFWNSIIPLLKKFRKKIIVPICVVNELVRLQEKMENLDAAMKARRAMKQLISLKNQGYIEIWGNPEYIINNAGKKKHNPANECLADHEFMYVFTRERLKYQLVLITQDKGLSKDILGLNNSQSVSGKQIFVCKINREGVLENAEQESSREKSKSGTVSSTWKNTPVGIFLAENLRNRKLSDFSSC